MLNNKQVKRYTLVILYFVLFSVGSNAQEVKILLMGDTQKTMDQKPDRFLATMDSLLADSKTNDANFVLQMGDIVESDADNSDRPQQYAIAQEGWRKLDGKIPYVLNLGNNDNAGEFLDNFPLSHYQSWSSFVSNYNNHRNVAHHFNAGEVDWLVISVRYKYNEDEMTWAENLIKNNPDKKVIFISHAANENGSEVRMCKKYTNVVLVLCGHTKSRHKLHTGNNGNKMGWIKTCQHSVDRDSYLCMVVFDVNTGEANIRYYSPLYGKYWDEAGAPFSAGQPEDSPWTWSGFQLKQTASSTSNQTKKKMAISVYPNPVNDGRFHIELPGYTDWSNVDIRITNLQGQTVYSTVSHNNNKIKVNTKGVLKASIYQLTVKSRQNFFTNKIIVH